MTRDDAVASMRRRAGEHAWIVDEVLAQPRYETLPAVVSPELAGRLVGDVGLWLRAVASGAVKPPTEAAAAST